jgi:hypothetical protein
LELSSTETIPEPPDYAQSQARLEALGIPPTLPREAVDYARKEAAKCTGNDVLAMRGFLEYGLPMRFLRDSLKPQGWKIGRRQNLEMVVSPDYSLAIISSAGNPDTGNPSAMPCTRTEKGPRTEDRIKETQLAMELPGLIEPQASQPTPGAMQSWFLLYFRDEEKREIRVELSRGVGFTVLKHGTGHGIVSKFEPRIFLHPITLDAEADTTTKTEFVHEEQGYEIEVTRRTG